MKIISSNSLMIVGFVISFVAIIINAIILTNINGKIGAIDGENARLNESLREQTVNGNEAESKFDDFLFAKTIADNSPAESREAANLPVGMIFNEAIIFLFSAANDVPLTEIRRAQSEDVDSEETQGIYEEKKKELETSPKNKKPETPKTEPATEEKNAEAQFLEAEREISTFDVEPNYGNLPKKLLALEIISEAVISSKNMEEMAIKLFPINKALNKKWLETLKAKQNRLSELNAQKSYLIRYQSYTTYAALSLQMLGLMIVFLKDVIKIKESSDDAK